VEDLAEAVAGRWGPWAPQDERPGSA
jgi:hypothetical protein